MSTKHKLELTRIGKEIRPKLEPRILPEDPDKSCLAGQRVPDSDIFDIRIIFGDNRLALCAAFRGDQTRWPNLTAKKSPGRSWPAASGGTTTTAQGGEPAPGACRPGPRARAHPGVRAADIQSHKTHGRHARTPSGLESHERPAPKE